MASSSETEKKSKTPVIAVSIAAAVIAVSAAVIVSVVSGGSGEEVDIFEDDVPLVGYDNSAMMILTEDDLNAARDLGTSAENEVALLYKNNAYSTDGETFSCYIVNNPRNDYDMFLTIYSDMEMKDEIFLSGLVPPGGGFEEITLERKLNEGDHTVCVVVTQVDTDESGAQVIKNQVSHTMEFHVE